MRILDALLAFRLLWRISFFMSNESGGRHKRYFCLVHLAFSVCWSNFGQIKAISTPHHAPKMQQNAIKNVSFYDEPYFSKLRLEGKIEETFNSVSLNLKFDEELKSEKLEYWEIG